MLKIRPVTPEDETDLSVLLVHAFAQPSEYRLVQALRENGDMAFELIAEMDGELSGYVGFSRLVAPQGWLVLAPLAVRPDDQRKGIGAELVRYGLDRARQMKYAAVIVVGSPGYYGKFGFLFPGKRRAELSSPYPAKFTGMYPIDPHAVQVEATLAYPAAFEDV